MRRRALKESAFFSGRHTVCAEAIPWQDLKDATVARFTAVGAVLPLANLSHPYAKGLTSKRESPTPAPVLWCLSRGYPRPGRPGKEAVGCHQGPIFRHFCFTGLGIKTQATGRKKPASRSGLEGHTGPSFAVRFPRHSRN